MERISKNKKGKRKTKMKTDGRRKNQPMKKQKRKLGNDIDQHKRLEKDKNKKAKL